MSRTPSQQCGHTTPPDRPHIDPVSRSHHPGQQIPLAYHQPYPLYEPRHFVPPDLGYERPALTTPPNPHRLPALGHLPERNADPRYMLSSDHGFMNRQPLPQTLPLRMQHHQQQQHHHHHGPPVADLRGYRGPTSYDERSSPMLSHGGDNVRHQLRTYDVES
ncbi:uncharacterized protein N7496_010222 [Penicillium cataractarum]|uniref:Uncharacterized protein n=1 Tax=Penicillium cataractarum TaxID=2100454 RepID=A0A9W9V1R2_9EURO|nr:uncharacterized protein N7496_010222 [Penicillium cataractarum]KAJ5364509.1 hypothetical protein N7496_010222 [Penicillium cataractarum]